jgi:hypothetical protein
VNAEAQTARVVLRYGFDARGRFKPEILAVDLLDVPPPLLEDDIPDRAAHGAWLDVLAPGGALALRVAVPAPGLGREAVDAVGALVRRATEGRASTTSAAVEVPWLGAGTRIVFRHGDGEEIATRSIPGLASLELVPNSADRTRLPGELVAVPVWGHDNPRAVALLFLAEAFRRRRSPLSCRPSPGAWSRSAARSPR